jgi:bifunctional DNA-binding transcriptional regulator/antitoxin component of YhaV-PrlF toxin-antitoxin module
MTIEATLTSKGQTTIPKDVRARRTICNAHPFKESSDSGSGRLISRTAILVCLVKINFLSGQH